MKNFVLALAITAALAASPAMAAKKPEAPIDPGPPPPSVEEFQKVATPALLAGFFDPAAAQIVWDRGVVGGWWQPPFARKVPGWFTCGLVNGKNRMGGYVGARRFVVVYFQGRITYSAIGQSDFDIVAAGCDKAIANGVLPVAGVGSIPATTPIKGPKLGVQFSVVPDGAYVSAVEPGSAAAEGGIVPGMVISHVNGIALKGFDQAMIGKVIQGTAATLTLTIIGKGDVTLTKRDPDAVAGAL